MKKLDIELIKYEKLKHINILVNRIQLRKEHVHNEFEFFVVLEGKGVAKIKNKSYSLEPNDVYLVNSGEVHSYHRDPAHSMDLNNIDDMPLFLFVQISNQCLAEYFPQIKTVIFDSCNLRSYFNEEEVTDVVKCLVNSAKDYFLEEPFYQLNVLSNVAKVLAMCFEKVPHEIVSETQKMNLRKKNSRIERIISYIDANFERQIRLQDLAEQENLSQTHFSHLFTSLFGITFQNYVNIKRMEQCVRLMPCEEKTLLEISYESGFSDPKYMNRMFVKHFGYTPKEYRKRQRLGIEQREINKLVNEFETIHSASDSIKVIKEFIEKYNYKTERNSASNTAKK